MSWRGAGGPRDLKDSTPALRRGHPAGGLPRSSRGGCRHLLRGRLTSPPGFSVPMGTDPSGAPPPQDISKEYPSTL